MSDDNISGRWHLDEDDGVTIFDPELTWQTVRLESRTDCENLIVLLEQVKEQWPR